MAHPDQTTYDCSRRNKFIILVTHRYVYSPFDWQYPKWFVTQMAYGSDQLYVYFCVGLEMLGVAINRHNTHTNIEGSEFIVVVCENKCFFYKI